MTQEEALDILKMGQNVFLTGPAGSGKTYLLNKYIEYLKEHEIPVAVTASTGIAATHMDGRTIHSWAGIKIKDHLTKKELNSIIYNTESYNRINNPKILIIDEISMLDARRFDLVNSVCRAIRKKDKPFGGLQLVVCGDFFQLPPVPKRGHPPPKFAFESSGWKSSNIIVCYLEKQYRQNDLRFLEILNAVRGNAVTEEIVNIIMGRHQKSIDGYSKPTKLYTHNRDVDAINSFELAQIKLGSHFYYMTFSGEPELVAELKKSCLAPQELELKKGAFVMFVKNNFDGGYVNGTLGTIVDFDKDDDNPIVEKRDGTKIVVGPASWTTEDDEGVVLARISQMPLTLAWAITVHKSQGMSLDCAEINLSRAFTEGMGYVALSRVRTLAGIKLMGLNEMSLKVNVIITELDEELKRLSEQSKKDLDSFGLIKKQSAIKSFLMR